MKDRVSKARWTKVRSFQSELLDQVISAEDYQAVDAGRDATVILPPCQSLAQRPSGTVLLSYLAESRFDFDGIAIPSTRGPSIPIPDPDEKKKHRLCSLAGFHALRGPASIGRPPLAVAHSRARRSRPGHKIFPYLLR